MTLRLRYTWLIALFSFALPAQAATSLSDLVIVDPTQRDFYGQLFVEAHGPQRSFARDLLPGRGDNHLAWFPQQYLLPLADNATPGAPLPGYLVNTDGSVSPAPTTLGVAQGTGIAGAVLSPTGNACYLADGSSNNLAAYQVDVQTSLFSNVAGAPFATDSNPDGVAVEPSGRFLYAVNGGSQSITIYSINLATQALTKIGTTATSVTLPRAINATRQCLFVASAGSGGYEVFAIDGATGALSGVPGSPVGTRQASSVARTPDGNYVYFSAVSPAGEIDGYFIDNATCALTAVPGSPFSGPGGGILRVNADVPAIYSAGSGSLQAFAIDPATGTLSSLGAALPVDPDTGAMVVGPKGLTLWLSDLVDQNLRSFGLDPVTGAVKTGTTPVTGPASVQSMVLLSPNGGALVSQGLAVNRSQRTLGGAPPYTYALIGGALPAGLSIDSTGKITGTATTLGQSTFDLLITDAVGATTSGPRTLKVVPQPPAPVAPSNLTASVVSSSQVRLNWQDNGGQRRGGGEARRRLRARQPLLGLCRRPHQRPRDPARDGHLDRRRPLLRGPLRAGVHADPGHQRLRHLLGAGGSGGGRRGRRGRRGHASRGGPEAERPGRHRRASCGAGGREAGGGPAAGRRRPVLLDDLDDDVPQQQPLQGPGDVQRRRLGQRQRPGRRADVGHRLPVVLQREQRRGDRQGAQRLRFERPLLGLRRRSDQRPGRADGDGYPDRRLAGLQQPSQHDVSAHPGHVGVFDLSVTIAPAAASGEAAAA